MLLHKSGKSDVIHGGVRGSLQTLCGKRVRADWSEVGETADLLDLRMSCGPCRRGVKRARLSRRMGLVDRRRTVK